MVSELRPRGIGEILDAAVGLYRARFTRLVRVAAFVVVPVQVLSALVLLSAQPDHFTLTVAGTVSPQYTSGSAAVELAAFVVVTIVGVLSTALIIAVCTRVIAEAYIGNTLEARDAFRAVRPRVFAIIGTSILVLVSEAIGFVACFVGALFPLTLFAVAMPVLILEGVGVSAAIGRSVTLTKTHALHVLGLVVTAQLLGAVLQRGAGRSREPPPAHGREHGGHRDRPGHRKHDRRCPHDPVHRHGHGRVVFRPSHP